MYEVFYQDYKDKIKSFLVDKVKLLENLKDDNENKKQKKIYYMNEVKMYFSIYIEKYKCLSSYYNKDEEELKKLHEDLLTSYEEQINFYNINKITKYHFKIKFDYFKILMDNINILEYKERIKKLYENILTYYCKKGDLIKKVNSSSINLIERYYDAINKYKNGINFLQKNNIKILNINEEKIINLYQKILISYKEKVNDLRFYDCFLMVVSYQEVEKYFEEQITLYNDKNSKCKKLLKKINDKMKDYDSIYYNNIANKIIHIKCKKCKRNIINELSDKFKCIINIFEGQEEKPSEKKILTKLLIGGTVCILGSTIAFFLLNSNKDKKYNLSEKANKELENNTY